MRIIAIANQKGGVGKTTTAWTLGRALADRGRSVLLIDLDPQMSLTIACGVQDAEGASMAEVMGGANEGELALRDIVRDLGDDLFVAPSDLALAGGELGLVQRARREYILTEALEGTTSDYVLIDCPPSLGILTVNALSAAGEVLIVLEPEYLALRGLSLFMQSIERTQARLNPSLEVLGVLPVKVAHVREHTEIIAAIKTRWPLVPVTIGRSIRVAEAPRIGDTILGYDKNNPQAEAYRKLAKWVDGRRKRGKA